MSKIRFDYKNGNFLLEGSMGEKFEYKGASQKMDFSQIINFYRVDNNFSYVRGRINFSDDCDNNLVVSDQINITISKTRNSLVIINKDNVEISPIQEVEASYVKCLELLNRKKVIYNIPKKVLMSERLKRKSREDLEEILIENYHLHPVQLSEIEESAKKNGIFYISDGSSKYIFKYLGEDEERVKAIFKVAKNMPVLFPIIKETTNGKAGVHLDDGFYGLEEFIEVERNWTRDLKYFTKLGKCMAVMHKQLSKLVENNPDLRMQFLSDAKHLSDSNLVSLGIDLALGGFEDINSEINQFAKLGLSKEVDSLPEYFIHGDLNGSNVIVTSNGLRFIDLERIKISKRVLELESPLIFGGNMAVPFYLKGSLKSLIEGYNCFAKYPLSDREQRLSINLIKYALIKNFVIRNIRRGEKANSKENLLANLSSLSKEVFDNE